MAQQSFSYDPEKLGRKRFPDNKQFRAELQGQTDLTLSALFDLLPSNYPKDKDTNLGILYRTLGKEASREQVSINAINSDKIYTDTRVKFLHQILGERLFLGSRISPVNYNDVIYREYLIAIKNAYLKGSGKQTIEEIINEFTHQNVNIKELYLEARKPGSAYNLTDTHKMLIEVFVDNPLSSGIGIAELSDQIQFFVNLVKPAHVLYDTKFIWTEAIDLNKNHDLIFGDTGAGCVPGYLYLPFNEKTILARQIIIVPPSSNPGVYKISSIHPEELILYLENDTKVIVEPGVDGTQIFGLNGKRIPFENLHIDQYVQIDAQTIPGDFSFYWLPPDLVNNWGARFYKNIYRKPAFQEFVKKEMDAHGRFPLQVKTTPTTLCDRWVLDALQPMYEDLRKDCSDRPEVAKSYTVTLAERMWSPRFAWENLQGEVFDREKTGDIYSFTMSNSPLTDSSGNPAAINDVSISVDGTALYGSVEALDASSAYVSLYNTAAYWDSSKAPVIGSEVKFDYFHGIATPGSDTFVFGIAQWQLPNVPVSNGQGTNFLATPSDIQVSVDGTSIPNAVVDINAILGYVTLQDTEAFWVSSPLGRIPRVGDTIGFKYYQSGNDTYAMLFDDIARVLDDSMTLDGADGTNDPTVAPAPRNQVLEIGYKFRTDLLHHASVLNSPDTLQLNNYQKPATRASIANRQDTINHFNYFFSPEHLTDPDTDIILNDQYLDKAIDPAIYLREGIPTFQETYGYQPKLIEERKLQDVRKHHHPLMYSDLLLKEFPVGDSVPLSTICDRGTYSFKIRYKEDLNHIEECESWVLFDTAEIFSQDVTIPSIPKGVINLRVAAKKLRKNFILRETETISAKITSLTYTEQVSSSKQVFQLPGTIVYQYQGYGIDFPSLPIVKDFYTLADITDIVVKENGVILPPYDIHMNPNYSLDAVDGTVTLATAISNEKIEIVYYIRSTATAQIVDPDRSRIFDYNQVMPAGCYDGFAVTVGLRFTEYINFLSDYGSGIKFTYLNKDTYQVEEHVFTGPVFETFDPHEDEITTPDSFPNALIRIRNPINPTNPLNTLTNYNFINDSSIRIRKKTIRELLPDRTFRTFKISEALPV